MNQTLLAHVTAKSLKKNAPDLTPGMTVKVSQKITEGGKERVQIFEGLIIAVNGGQGINGTFTVRKMIKGFGVEKIFPLHGKTIVKIEIVKKAKVRRSKLYYMRDLQGKAARMQEQYVREVAHDAAEETSVTEAAESQEAGPAKDSSAPASAPAKPAKESDQGKPEESSEAGKESADKPAGENK